MRAKQKREQETADSLVGWMGLTLSVPEGWSPVSVSGEGEQGYLKVVSPDTRFLEVKWDRPRGAVSVPGALEGYLRKLERAARKAKREVQFRRRPRGLGAVRPQSQAPIPYSWEADRKAFGCIWHCGECGRLVIAEVVGEPDDDLSLAGDLLRRIRDHGEDGWNTWALYGLTVPAPSSYRMERHLLMTGHQRFELRDRGSTIRADRWGLAGIALRGTTLQRWYTGRETAALSRYVLRTESTEVHGHPGLRISGRMRLPFGIWTLLRSAHSLSWPRFYLHGCVWHCPESNRIYSILGEQPRKSRLVEEIAGRTCCHAP